MNSIAEISQSVTPFQNKWIMVVPQQHTTDIIKLMLREHENHTKDYDAICQRFWKGNALDTGKYLFDYCKRNIKYRIEPDNIQTVKSPAAIAAHGYGDCKHYSSFICGVLDALKRKGYKVNFAYRFASYKMGEKEPHHVFAVLFDKGRTYYIDPVLRYFNEKKPYYYSSDKKPKNMLYAVSGIDDGIGRKKKASKPAKNKEAKKTARKEERKRIKALPKKERRKARAQKIKTKLKKFNVPLVTARNSYLLLAKMNLFRISSRIGKRMQENPKFREDLKREWEKLGGNYTKLRTAINQGINVWNKRHSPKIKHIGYANNLNDYGWDNNVAGFYIQGVGYVGFEDDAEISGMGAIGAAPAAAGVVAIIAAALPVIAKLASMFKRNGIDTSDMTKEGAASAEDLAESLTETAEALEDGGTGETVERDRAKMYADVKKDSNGNTEVSIKDDTFSNTDGEVIEVDKRQVVKGGGSGITDRGKSTPFADFGNTISNFYQNYKKPIIYTGIGIAVLAIGKPILERVIDSKPRRRR